jgi:hypothetical protein
MSLAQVMNTFAAANDDGTRHVSDEDFDDMLDKLRALGDPSVRV